MRLMNTCAAGCMRGIAWLVPLWPQHFSRIVFRAPIVSLLPVSRIELANRDFASHINCHEIGTELHTARVALRDSRKGLGARRIGV